VYRYTKRDLAPARLQRTAEARPPGQVLPRGDAFRRDAPTLLCYGAISVYAFWLYAYGPALALLQTELHFSYTVLGVYSALWSAGAVVTGACFARLARRLPRAPLLWSAAAGAVAGAGLFAAARTVALTMLGAAMLGFAGTVLLTCTQAVLSDGHGPRRDRALTEANVGAAGCAVLASLLLGLLEGTPAGWRPVLALPALALAGLYLRYRREPLPAGPTGRATRGRLPLKCWLLATMTAIGIAVEFSPIYFGAELLTATGLRTARARRDERSLPRHPGGPLAKRVRLARRTGRAVRCCGPPGGHRRRVRALLAGGLARPGHRRAVPVRARHRQPVPPSHWPTTLDAGPAHATHAAPIQLLGGVLVIAAPTSSAASPITSDCAPPSPSSRCSSWPAPSCSWPDSGW
jgi:hypothetical protein